MRFSAGFLVVFLFSFTFNLQAQVWVSQMEDPNVNFYEVQNNFNSYWDDKTIEKGKGWKQFKRWEYFMEQRVYPHGDRNIPARAMELYMRDYLKNQSAHQGSKAANWSLIGPQSSIPTGGGAGRINAVRFDPANSSIVWACSPAGGLWKSTTGGTSWSTNTDNLSVIGTTDIAIHPFNSNILYLATGDGDAGDTYSIGVLKSIDGGVNWSASGLSWTVNQTRRISKLLIHPSNPDTILAATSNGIYRSLNGGTTWTQVATGNYKDMEFKPGDPSVIYASGTSFVRSVNGGTSFSAVTSGLPTSGVSRFAIATTTDDASYVYVLAGSTSGQGFLGLYRSVDGGTTFTTMSTSPNLLGWSSSGSDNGGQAWYDLAVAASPTNKNEVWVGGVNIWRSIDGGSNWAIKAHWAGSGGNPYVHADIHDLVFLPGTSTLFVGNDGGVYKTTNGGTNWTDLSNGLQIAQMYRLSTSATNNVLNISGWQDNGTNRVNNGVWSEIFGGDGMECIIDPVSSSIMYVSLYYGEIFKSTNGGNSFSSTIVNSGGSGVDADGAWVTPYILAPTSNTTIFIGKSQVYKSTDSGNTFNQVGTVSGGTGKIIALANAPSDINYIYAAKGSKLWVSSNGTSFVDRTAGLPVASASITYIAISPLNPAHAWVTFSGYSSANKVFYTSDAGATWSNYSTGLPNLPVNCVVYQNGTNDGLYVGTDVGVYYRDNSMTSWLAYNTGLPNVIVNELEIHYGTGKLRAATYGRGMWESDLNAPGNLAPVANFSANNTVGCPGSIIQFTDQSAFLPSGWSWSFPGGTPSTSTNQNPVVIYNTPGVHSVTLTSTNANGSDSEVKTSYITIANPQPLPLSEGFQQTSFPPADWSIDNADNSASWVRTTAAGGFGTSNASVRIDNFNDNLGVGDALITPHFSIGASTSLKLYFDVAYAPYSSSYSDSLSVYYSTDCGDSYLLAYQRGGNTLSTAPATTSFFVPSASQWRKDSAILTGLGSLGLIIKFVNHGNWGNVIYLDNINIGNTTAAPVAKFSTSADSLCEGGSVSYFDQSGNFPATYSWSFPGGNPATSIAKNPVVNYNSAGTYTSVLTVTNNYGTDTSQYTITVHPYPVQPSITTSSGTLVSSAAIGNQWLFYGGILPGDTNNTYTPSSNGVYSVKVTGPGGCSTTSENYSIFVGMEEEWMDDLTLMPNPSNGQIFLSFYLPGETRLELELWDLSGRRVFQLQELSPAGNVQLPINLGHVDAGAYLLRMSSPDGSVTRKVIIQ